jgi:hypothetical protein
VSEEKSIAEIVPDTERMKNTPTHVGVKTAFVTLNTVHLHAVLRLQNLTKDAFCIYGFRMILTVNSDYFLKQR